MNNFMIEKTPFREKSLGCVAALSGALITEFLGQIGKKHFSRAMARTKQRARKPKLKKSIGKEEAWAEHVQLEIAGELSVETSSWKGRMVELVGLFNRLLMEPKWEVVKDLRDESRQAIVCPVCTVEITTRGRQAPSIVPCHLFPVHLDRIHQIVGDLYLTCPTCKKVPGRSGVSKVERHYENGGCSEPALDRETVWKGVQKTQLAMAVMDLKVWEVERIRPGQVLVACPVCKLEKEKGVRVHESMVKSNQFKNHFEQEHKPLKFLLKYRCLKCPICQDFVPPGLLGVHFDQGRSCEKAVVLAEKAEVPIKEEGGEVKMEIGGARDPESSTIKEEYVELSNPNHEVKMESGAIIKTEAVEEFYGQQTSEWVQMEVPSLSKEEILKEIKANVHHVYKEVFHVKEMEDEYIHKLIQKYHRETNQPITLLKRLTKDLFYKYKHEPQQGQDLAWKCWITSSSGITICARDRKKKGAMLKTALKALSQLFSINYPPSS